MDELVHSLCVLNLELLPKQGTTFGTKDAGWLQIFCYEILSYE